MAKQSVPQKNMVRHGGPGGPRAMGPMGKPDKATIRRLLGYIFRDYTPQFILVIVCIIINAITGVIGSKFIGILIDDYITPMIGMENPVFTELIKLIGIMAVIYLAGVAANFGFNRIMVTISQGVQKKIRDEMFEKMQKLPISYFDRNSNGDIMSHYTNDIDTLRQMLSRAYHRPFLLQLPLFPYLL